MLQMLAERVELGTGKTPHQAETLLVAVQNFTQNSALRAEHDEPMSLLSWLSRFRSRGFPWGIGRIVKAAGIIASGKLTRALAIELATN